ncbi:hypothetical protein [Marinomonas posidonica]|uniref:Uncharacterized protein n=1 Tax=Marinomonas posidonica (strain CECT 7376 / NCIMB 14433 / IVIA-Po-181) TaxID=491952 RepID=F6CW10_MARPP|nr:hypothetical protein [Marinomonas posidonica]AEF54309.1 hypothetical protein Mar181_1262 [Marinomonas posidonica IVIA-Po-181]
MTDIAAENIVARDFSARPLEEQQDFMTQTWCNQCMEVDLGMTDPQEFESQGRIWIEGNCVKCGEKTVTEIVEEDDE